MDCDNRRRRKGIDGEGGGEGRDGEKQGVAGNQGQREKRISIQNVRME